MQSLHVYCYFLLATTLVFSGHSFTVVVSRKCTRSSPTSVLYGKNPIKKIKKLFRGTSPKSESNFPADGKMVKLSSGRAKELAKKYADIDDVGERAYQMLIDLDMVGKSFA